MAASLLDQLGKLPRVKATITSYFSRDLGGGRGSGGVTQETVDVVRAADLDALCRSWPADQDWQLMASAPKDGTPLLVWADGSHIIHIFWKADHWEWLGGGLCPDGQYRMTHWMPLPSPPLGGSEE